MSRSLKLVSSMAPSEVLKAVIDLYGIRNSAAIDAHAGGGVEVARQVATGAEVDIVVLAAEAIEGLIIGGHVSPVGRVNVMKSGIAIAVKAGAPHPKIRDSASVREAVTKAAAISYSTGPSGRYLEKLFDRWRIFEAPLPRVLIPAPGIPVARLIARGDAELGFQQLSELINAPGIEVVGTLPDPIQHFTTFVAAITVACTNLTNASAFLSFLVSPQTQEIIGRLGMLAAR